MDAPAAAENKDVGAYDHAVSYWDRQPATADGVLGGFGHVSDADLRDSEELLLRALRAPLEQARAGGRRLVAVDCGAGVGRVSRGLLLRHFSTVDLLEPSRHLLDTAVRDLKARAGEFPQGHAVGRVICKGLQEFEPGAEEEEEGGAGEGGGGATGATGGGARGGPRYDCIWVQWCMLYLTDDDVVRLMDRCLRALKPDGILFVKENICKEGAVPDGEDASVTRSDELMRRLFERAGAAGAAATGGAGGGGAAAAGAAKRKWKLVHNVKQRNFPKNLFEVRMYVLKLA